MRNIRSLFIAGLALSLGACTSTPDPKAAPAAPTQGADATAPTGKLPEGVAPSAYRLDLVVDPRDELGFSGTVEIDITLDAAQSGIWLHGRDLEAREVQFTPDGGAALAGTYAQKSDQGLARLDFPAPIGPGKGTLRIVYDAKWGPGLSGLYRVTQGEEPYAFTQFEATSARYAFPGFDEPRFKTPFAVSLTAPEDMVAIGNTIEDKAEPASPEGKSGAWTRHVYRVTEKLPTYLLAFAVGHLDVVEAKPIAPNAFRRDPLPFRGIAAKGRGKELAYALEHTPAYVASLERYFARPYPYDKLDILAVPDFAAGAMENAGAITFREWLILVDEKAAPANQKRAFAGVMSHELAHQWFGNLVTMPWWDDIWLNEAFATWMAGKVIEETHPEYEAPIGSLERTLYAMDTDSLVAARQIRQPIESDHDIDNAFDSITYSKGGGVLAMFERYVGKDTFRDGLRQYMARHAFGSATYEDLLVAISDAAGKDVAPAFKTFLFQPGVPLVEAELKCDDAHAEVALTQSRFLPLGSKGESDRQWMIPLCLRYGDDDGLKETCTLLTEKSASVPLEGKCPSYLLPNADSAAYVRWTMPAVALRALLEGKASNKAGVIPNKNAPAQKAPKLTVRERRGVADAVAVGLSTGRLSLSAAMPLLEILARDPHPKVAEAPLRQLTFLHKNVVDEGTRGKVEIYARALYRPVLQGLGEAPRPDDTPEQREFRATVMDFLLKVAHDEDLRARLAPLGRKYLGGDGPSSTVNPAAVSPEIASAALSAAVMEGDAHFFGAVASRLSSSKDALVRGRVLGALASTENKELAARAVLMLVSDDLRTNETPTLLGALINNPHSRDATWAFMKERFEDVRKHWPAGWEGDLPLYVTGFCGEDNARDVEAFFEPRVETLPGGPRNLALALEAIELCTARVSHHKADAERFFTTLKQGPEKPGATTKKKLR